MQETDIQRLIPQRKPFIMVDELLETQADSAISSFEIRAENVLLDGEEFSSAGILENMAQTCAAHIGSQSSEVRIGYIGAVNNFKTVKKVLVGETLKTRINVLERFFDVSFVRAEVFSGEEMVACADLKIALHNDCSSFG